MASALAPKMSEEINFSSPDLATVEEHSVEDVVRESSPNEDNIAQEEDRDEGSWSQSREAEEVEADNGDSDTGTPEVQEDVIDKGDSEIRTRDSTDDNNDAEDSGIRTVDTDENNDDNEKEECCPRVVESEGEPDDSERIAEVVHKEVSVEESGSVIDATNSDNDNNNDFECPKLWEGEGEPEDTDNNNFECPKVEEDEREPAGSSEVVAEALPKEVGDTEVLSEQEIEIEGPSSPSSSGYAGGRGSSSASVGSGSGIAVEEITEREDAGLGFYDNGNGGEVGKEGLVTGKRNINEDESSISWRKRKKHFFVLSNSGKPIYSRYGDEYKLAGFSATLQAIISFVENGGDHIKLVRAGHYQIIFLVKGPIYLVCISCTEEPYQALRGQLELLYGQMLLILTKSIDKCFEKNSKFDMTPLLGGTDVVFSSLLHSFSWNPATYLHAYTCLYLPYSIRQAAGAVLQDVAESGVLFAILMCGHKVISLVGAQKAILHPDDMLLLSNFVLSSESLRTSESFSPICLPKYNAMAFLYAYVQYLDVETYLVLLTTNSDAFFHLKECRIRIENVLIKSKVLSEVQMSMLEGGLHIEDLPGDLTLASGSVYTRLGQDKNLDVPETSMGTERTTIGIGGPAGLWHFMYRSNYLDQYVASKYSPPINNHNAQKRLFRAYQKLYDSMHDRNVGLHKMQYRKDENYVLLCWISQDFELYAAFDPLAEKSSAITVCNRVCQWIRDTERDIFLLDANPLSW